ncbi:hypothetical protein M758_8G145800 [Ceratodon purpureus]|uniref:Uncharacterized protein n=1 Tax=Ceratodon purpureus TaxID=3225 RepID=A0A8T0H3J6_CERPU|nr:hypothetical protein KC19_8G149500 [Ceratodon purpureus]KAG0608947.1 hypothetical protein M758_8G145800 [Ceratodon purpureus]
MAGTRAAVVVGATVAMAATGASLAYVYFTGPPHPPPMPSPDPSPLPSPQPAPPPLIPASTRHLYSPPPDLPLSSKLPIIPDSNFEELDPGVTSQCDYAPLWECIVNGNGGCEVLEQDLRECLQRCAKTSRSS